MSIPNLVPLIKTLCERFPAAWAKAKKPHDDGEFNARVCAVLHHEMGITEVGRNGKRGDPKNLSKDVINWKGEGNNPDPTTGDMGTIIDFIGSHEAAGASIIWGADVDPSGPGAWVKPLTLAQIDKGEPTQPTKPVVPPYPGDPVGNRIGEALFADYAEKGEAPNSGMVIWAWRCAWDMAVNQLAPDAAIAKHRKEWRAALGL